MMSLQEHAFIRHLHELNRAILEAKLPHGPGDARSTGQQSGRQITGLCRVELLFQPISSLLWNLKATLLKSVKYAARAKSQAEKICLKHEWICGKQSALFSATHVRQEEAPKVVYDCFAGTRFNAGSIPRWCYLRWSIKLLTRLSAGDLIFCETTDDVRDSGLRPPYIGHKNIKN